MANSPPLGVLCGARRLRIGASGLATTFSALCFPEYVRGLWWSRADVRLTVLVGGIGSADCKQFASGPGSGRPSDTIQMSTRQDKAGAHVTSNPKSMTPGTGEGRKGKLQLVVGVRFSEIGWFGGDGGATSAPSRLSLPLAGPAVEGVLTRGADVTGPGKGGRGRKARAVGVGMDRETQAAAELSTWEASSDGRAEIGAAVRADASAWEALRMVGEHAAAGAAWRVGQYRGAVASRTSREDAAADAVSALATRYPVGCLTARNFSGRRLSILRRHAGRAAFKSLASWACKGMTAARVWDVQALTDGLTAAMAAAASPAYEFSGERDARRAALRFVFGVGLRDFRAALLPAMRGGARAVALRQARARCRVLGNVILGATLTDAVAQSGQAFGTVAAWCNSCQRARLFPALQAARAAASWQGRTVRDALAAMRGHGVAAAAAVRAMRAASDGGRRVCSRSVAVSTVVLRAGASVVTTPVGVHHLGAVLAGVALVRRAPWSRVHRLAVAGKRGTGAAYLGTWATAAEARGYHVGQAVFWRDAARRAMADDRAAFNRVLERCHSDERDLSSLRAAFGICDQRGRLLNGRKLDGAARRKPSGKVQRAAAPVRVVSVVIATRYGSRVVECSPASGLVEFSGRVLASDGVASGGLWLAGAGAALVRPAPPAHPRLLLAFRSDAA